MSETSDRRDPPGHGGPEAILEYLARSQRPLKLKEIARGIGVGEEGYPDLKRTLGGLTDEGRVYRIKSQRYALPEQINLVVGTLDATRRGAGFVVPEKKKAGDLHQWSLEL